MISFDCFARITSIDDLNRRLRKKGEIAPHPPSLPGVKGEVYRVSGRAELQKMIAQLRDLGDIRNPERLLKRLASIVFWVLLLLPLVGIPLFFLIYSAVH